MSGEVVQICSGPLRAELTPERGGRMSRLHHRTFGDILVPLPEADFDPLAWPKAGAFPLIPFHNRLAGAEFVFAGRHHRVLPHTSYDGDAMHGPAQRRAWRTVRRGGAFIELQLDYAADADWPFPFRATQSFRLQPDRLEVELAVLNTGGSLMPAGIGWHPYFAAAQSDAVQCAAATRWLIEFDPFHARPLKEKAGGSLRDGPYPRHFSEWDRVSLHDARGLRLELTASPGLPFLVIHRTPAYVCLEPVSHLAGALGSGETGSLALLEPGEALAGSIGLRIA